MSFGDPRIAQHTTEFLQDVFGDQQEEIAVFPGYPDGSSSSGFGQSNSDQSVGVQYDDEFGFVRVARH
jgi:hypothetical protein